METILLWCLFPVLVLVIYLLHGRKARNESTLWWEKVRSRHVLWGIGLTIILLGGFGLLGSFIPALGWGWLISMDKTPSAVQFAYMSAKEQIMWDTVNIVLLAYVLVHLSETVDRWERKYRVGKTEAGAIVLSSIKYGGRVALIGLPVGLALSTAMVGLALGLLYRAAVQQGRQHPNLKSMVQCFSPGKDGTRDHAEQWILELHGLTQVAPISLCFMTTTGLIMALTISAG